MNNKIILQVKDLVVTLHRKRDQDVDLVHGISFDLHKSEMLGLVGESGSGKSLSSLSILQLLPQNIAISSGQVIFDGVDLCQKDEDYVRMLRGKRIAMIFQEPMSSLNPLIRCGAQVDEIMRIHENINKAEAKKRTLDLFSMVKLPDADRAYNSYPFELSGGQLQRIMISMAIACRPDVLIADECTTALDVTVQKEILSLMRGLNEKLGIAILFISHDLDVISEIADRVMVMRNGKIVEQASVKQIFELPNHAYTKQLIASKPPLDINLKSLPKPSYFKEVDSTAQAFYKTHLLTTRDIENRRKSLDASPVVLSVVELSKFYTSQTNFWGKATAYVHAVDHVSFDIRKGETVGLVGESGCGKSTLSKALLRLIEPDSGEVIFQDKSFTSLNSRELRAARKEVQYIFQDPFSSLNPRLTVGYAIQEPMQVHRIRENNKDRKERVMELLELVGLERAHYDRYPHEFSGGQRQRICIARALGMEPSVIVCDEIVSALDVSVQAQVLNLLIELRDKLGLSLLFVSHDLSIVKFISDRILVMRAGKIVEEGWAEEVYQSPKDNYTKQLLNSIPGTKKIFDYDN